MTSLTASSSIATKSNGFASRAVSRSVEPGSFDLCAGCGLQVKFRAKVRQSQVVANVYVDSVWNRVEHYHGDCYEQAGLPYGPPPETVSHRDN